MDSKYKLQTELERLYSKNELMPRMSQYFIDEGFDALFEEAGFDPKMGITLLVQMALHKRCDAATLIGIMKNHFDSPQECANTLEDMAEIGYVKWDDKLRIFITQFTIPASLQAEIDQFQFPLPMVVEPRKLKCNRDTGYLVSGAKASVILKDNHTEDDVCLDHLNRVNRVKLTLDIDTALMVENKWKDIDKRKSGETAEKFEKRKRAFVKYNKHALKVFDKLLEEGNEFYMTHRYDKRGRTYCQGYYVNPQGNEWNKATVAFANQEVVQ